MSGFYDTLAAAEAEAPQGPTLPPPPPIGSPTRPNVLPPPSEAKPQAPAPSQAKSQPSLLGRVIGGITGRSPEDVDSGIISGAKGTAQGASAVAQAVPAAIIRAPGQLAGGLMDTSNDVHRWEQDNIDAHFVRGGMANKALSSVASAATNTLMPTAPLGEMASAANHGASLADTLSFRQSLGQVGDPGVNQLTTQALASLPFMAAGGPETAAIKGLAAKVVPLLVNSGKVGLGAFVTADTSGDKPGGEALLDRAQQGAEGFVTNLAAEPLLGLLHNFIKAKPPTTVTTASPVEAAQDSMDRAYASARTNEASNQAVEAQIAQQDAQATEAEGKAPPAADAKEVNLPQGPEKLDAGTRHTDTAPQETPQAPGGTQGEAVPPEAKLYTDANNALRHAGINDPVAPETHPLTPDGRIPVAPAVKDALDKAGLGRTFAANNEAPRDAVIFKETSPDGGSRVVGSMSKEDLQGFKDEVEQARGEIGAGEDIPDTTSAHPTGQFKLSNLGAPYDVPPFIRALADLLPRRTPATDASIMAGAKSTADAIGYKPADIIAYVANAAGDSAMLPEVMATVRTVFTRASTMADAALEAQHDWSTVALDHPDLKAALSAVHNVITLAQSVSDFKAGIGGALRMSGMPDADSYIEGFTQRDGATPKMPFTKQVDPLDGLPKLPKTPEELDLWKKAWDFTKGDPGARAKLLDGLTFFPGKWMALRTSFANFYTGAIISAPITFARDLLGPATIGTLRTLERSVGGATLALNPFVDDATRQDALRSAQDAWPAYMATIGDMRDCLNAAVKSYQSGVSVLAPHENPVYDLRSKGIPQGLIDAATAQNPGVTGQVPYLLANAINAFPSWIHAIHGGVNEFAQRLSYLGEVRAQAMLEAHQQGLEANDFNDYVRDKVSTSVDPLTGQGNNLDAIRSSQRTTLIQPVGGGEATQAFAKAVRTMQTNLPESRYVLPIFTIPANALGETLRRIPFMGQFFSETSDELAGKAGVAAQAEAYGRAMSGAAMLAGGYALANAGLLTGAGPQDPHARALWEAQGFQPYSVKIGGTWVSFAKLDVVGDMLAIPASIYDKSVHTQLDQQNGAYAGVAALAQFMKDKAALEGVSQLLSFGGSPAESAGYLSRLMNTVTSGFVPNFIKTLGRDNLDASMRTARTPFEAILNRLPGASQLLDPQRNALGEETHKVQSLALNTLPFSLSSANTYAKDPEVDELYRLYKTTGFAPGVKSPALPGGKEDMRDVKLEDGHSLYDALMRYRTTSTVDGQTLRQAMTNLFASPEYNAAVDGNDKADDLASRNGMVQKLFHEYDTQARRDVAQASPTAARMLAIGMAKAGNNAVLRNTSTADIAKNPDLLKAMGINISDFEDQARER